MKLMLHMTGDDSWKHATACVLQIGWHALLDQMAWLVRYCSGHQGRAMQ